MNLRPPGRTLPETRFPYPTLFRSAVEDLLRTMTSGLVGTPMPSCGRALPEEDRWALSYYVLALAAFTDPLTGEPLPIRAQDRAALNDPALKAPESHYAYKPQSQGTSTEFAENPPADRKSTRLNSSH